MTDENPDNVSAGPYGGDDPADPRPVSLADTNPYAGGQPVDTGIRLERERAKAQRPDCPTCRGTGKVLTLNDHLRASLELLGDDPAVPDRFAAEFYGRLFARADYLRTIFPRDLDIPESDPNGKGRGQRDKLVAALFALGNAFDPDDPKKMEVLDQHLAAFGRAHSAFEFPDGVRPPTLEEYNLVKLVLFDLLIEVSGEGWRAEFGPAWSEAYDYAYRKMGDAAWKWLQENGGQVHPRSVRQ